MFNGEKVLAIIPARGGSKGIPHKNIIDLGGKPLIDYTIEAAIKSTYIDYVLVTTDDYEIAEVSKAAGASVPFLRPEELAHDNSRTIDAVMHAIDWLAVNHLVFQTVILLQPTQPFRDENDIDAAIRIFYESGKESVVSVCEAEDHPLLLRKIENGRLNTLLSASSTCRRQDMPVYYKVNGCIYINSTEEINADTSFNDNRIPFVMPKEKSVDIDDFRDLEYARFLISKMCE